MLVATFSVGGAQYAVDALRVQEALRPQPITEVPLAPPTVRGLMNLRGQLVTALDLHRILGVEPPHDPERLMNVVVDGPAGPVSLQVDAIGDVIEVDGELAAAPATVLPDQRRLIEGVCPLPDSLMVVLDIDAVDESAQTPPATTASTPHHSAPAPSSTTNLGEER